MSILLIAEHDNSSLKVFTLNAIQAASKINTDIHVLVAGNKSENVAKEVAAVPLVKKVLHSESQNYSLYVRCTRMSYLPYPIQRNPEYCL